MCDENKCNTATGSLPLIEVKARDRRRFLAGVASLPLAQVLAFPELAHAAGDKLETVAIEVNGRQAQASLALPAQTPAPAVMLIHEWWGLNDQIKAVAAELAQLGYVALAVDLYEGGVTADRDEARALMKKVESAQAEATLASWHAWLSKHSGSNGKIGTVGWCFGGGWSLKASLVASVDATVIYYGNVALESGQLQALSGKVLGHFATRDGWINQDMVNGFEQAMAAAGKGDQLQVHWYEADHAFANPSSARYDAEDAALSWQRTTEFFRTQLGT